MTAPAGAAWRPRTDLRALRRRAALLAAVRDFFAGRGVLEVETPLLAAHATPDAHIDSLRVVDAAGRPAGWLQFSPEFAMKRLLAAGSGPIFQVGKAFRGGERGRWHNPEFTMLEWYRPGFDHHALIDEVDDLLAAVSDGAVEVPARLRFSAVFEDVVGTAPAACEDGRLAEAATRHGVVGAGTLDRTELLDALLAAAVQPALGDGPVHLLDFPPELAALAQVRGGVAERFELYLGGLEVANGYHELLDSDECRRRMAAENGRRRRAGRPEHPVDERLLAALQAGLPASAGVALGIDRLLAHLEGAGSLDAVVAFPADIA